MRPDWQLWPERTLPNGHIDPNRQNDYRGVHIDIDAVVDQRRATETQAVVWRCHHRHKSQGAAIRCATRNLPEKILPAVGTPKFALDFRPEKE